MNDYLAHYGTKFHSGRYPYGSGDDPYQHDDFRSIVKKLRASGMSDTEIARSLGMNTSEFRNKVTIEKHERDKEMIFRAQQLRDTGMGPVAIAKEMSNSYNEKIGESKVRSWLKEDRDRKVKLQDAIKDRLQAEVDKRKYLDVGDGSELQLGVSKVKLKAIISDLEKEGYKITEIYQPQATDPHQYTTIKVLSKADVPKDELYKNADKIMSPDGFYIDGDLIKEIKPPVRVSMDRLQIVYPEQGGADKDGLIELRPTCEDLYMNGHNYSQVRIAMDNDLYLKGMAVYNNDLPPGVDIRFNVSKDSSLPLEKVLKPMRTLVENGVDTGKIDPDHPFGDAKKLGATFTQFEYVGKDGEKHQSPLNIVNDPDDWNTWSKTLSSQFLSKQDYKLAQTQLNKTFDQKQQEFNELMSLTNPVVKQKMLDEFASDCDSSATHLKACGFDRQQTHVLLPVPSLKNGEVFAPNYKNGEEVILIRYPHAGIFEIPRLKVNNNNPEAVKMIGKDAPNAIGINVDTARQLSGADFDGDTAVVIPTKGLNIKTEKVQKEYLDFIENGIGRYTNPPGVLETKKNPSFHKQSEMGIVSNLITDMTLKGAPMSDIMNAVKYSQVIIDAEKHNYDWKQAAVDLNIAHLHEKYQGKAGGGASTLISRASGDYRVNERKLGQYWPVLDEKGNPVLKEDGTPKTKLVTVDPNTGEKLYRDTNRTYLEPLRYKGPDGKWVYEKDDEGHQIYTDKEKRALTTISKMDAVKDAFELSSGTVMETVYANYANKLKALANTARKESLSTPMYARDPAAARTYSEEVNSLRAKLNDAKLNAPRERQAQMVAGRIVAAQKKSNPDMEKDEIKKLREQAIREARARVGASGKETRISFTNKEWEAIQAHAVSPTNLREMMRYCDDKQLKNLATPRSDNSRLSASQEAQVKAFVSSGRYTQAEVAERFGISVSSVNKIVNPPKNKD